MELSQPLAVIDGLFAQRAQGEDLPTEWGEREHFIQALGLQDEQAFQRIPCLNDVELAEGVRPFSLVRYRGMVQDVFEPEMYVSCVQELDAAGDMNGAKGVQESRLRTTKYREYVEAGPGKVIQELDTPELGQRGAFYCVPLPGESAWAKAAAAAAGPALKAATQAGTARAKRGRDDDADESMGEPGESMQCRPCAPRTQSGPGSPQRDGGVNGDEFGLNFPLPWEEARGRGASTACIVKTYDADAESLRLCEIVEVLGVLCVNPEIANLEMPLEDAFGQDARHPSTALVPRLHAILVRKLPFYHPAFPFTPQWLSEARLAAAYQANFSQPGAVAAVRAAALDQLTRHLGGDTMAAEYALMALFSRSFGQHADQALGSWSLNLTRWPRELDVQAFAQAAGELVPRAVCLEVNCKTLGERPWKPIKDFAAERLLAAQLQLAPGTLLVLDETQMAEGHLTAPGVNAIKTIGTLVTDQVLPCDFSAYDVNVPLELSIILVSQGKSIVKEVDLAVPLQAEHHQAGAGPAASSSGLEGVRLYLGLATRLPKALEIAEDLTERIAGDFCEIRQELQVPSALCSTWLSLARAFCLSYGEAELSEARWSALLELEKKRLRRCVESGMFPAA